MHVQDVLPRDAIESVDDPSFGADYFGDAGDEVVVLDADPPRAYPVRVLDHHEVVNDVLDGAAVAGDGADAGTGDDADAGTGDDANAGADGAAGPGAEGRPVAVTWCPICASAVVFDRRVGGRTLTFGVSGTLADDALVLYDRETGSEWKQPLGRAIAGPHEGTTLDVLPATTTTCGQFRAAHPEGVVLGPPRGGDRAGARAAYDPGRYEAYDRAAAFGLRAMRGEGPEREWDRTDLDAKATVLGVLRDGAAVGYPRPVVVAAGGVVRDAAGDAELLVVATDGAAGTDGSAGADGSPAGDDAGGDRERTAAGGADGAATGRDDGGRRDGGRGGGLHAYAAPAFDVEYRDGRLHGDGTAFDPATGRGADGRRLAPVPARRMYAVAWQDDHGPDSFYGL